MKQTAGVKKTSLKLRRKKITPTLQYINNAHTAMIFVLGRDQNKLEQGKGTYLNNKHTSSK